jgi:hypothetical protein
MRVNNENILEKNIAKSLYTGLVYISNTDHP